MTITELADAYRLYKRQRENEILELTNQSIILRVLRVALNAPEKAMISTLDTEISMLRATSTQANENCADYAPFTQMLADIFTAQPCT